MYIYLLLTYVCTFKNYESHIKIKRMLVNPELHKNGKPPIHTKLTSMPMNPKKNQFLKLKKKHLKIEDDNPRQFDCVSVDL